jgi:predicted small integral membrane protein
MASALRSIAAVTLVGEGLFITWIAAINGLTARMTGSIENDWSDGIWFAAYLAVSLTLVVLLWAGGRAMWRARSSGPKSSRDRSIIRIVALANLGIGALAGLMLAGGAMVPVMFAGSWLIASLFSGLVALATAREDGSRSSGEASHGSTPVAPDP